MLIKIRKIQTLSWSLFPSFELDELLMSLRNGLTYISQLVCIL